jgi:HSP20 family molecular chaperone IbpA
MLGKLRLNAGFGQRVVPVAWRGFKFEVPVAGYTPEEIEVTLERNALRVQGKSAFRQFTRSLLLPEEIDGDNIAATVEHGLLTLTLNVQPKVQRRKIEITHR